MTPDDELDNYVTPADGIPAEVCGLEPTTWPNYGGIARNGTPSVFPYSDSPITLKMIQAAYQNAVNSLYPENIPKIKGMNLGIQITGITCDEPGWVVARYCPACKTTIFEVDTWAAKPVDGDFFLVTGKDFCEKEECRVQAIREVMSGKK